MEPDLCFTIPRHCVPFGPDELSPLQRRILDDPAPIRIFSAPTGAGKSFALIRAVQRDKAVRVLFVVPTRRLAQNLCDEARRQLPAPPGGPSPVALWSSDETGRQRDADPAYRPGPARVRQALEHEDVRFIVATPESVAQQLLRAPTAGPGGHSFGLSTLMGFFDHIVFDEFHSIDARGFGLCAVVARGCADEATRTRVTFLSATPIDLVPVLTALGIPRDSIVEAQETVADRPKPDGLPEPGWHVLHGDVEVAFVTEPDMASLLLAQQKAIRACLNDGRQLVIVFDSLEELHIEKLRLAAVLDQLGVPASERLAINSIDDSTRVAGLDGVFVTDRNAVPEEYPVLVATSSIEMGVTFKAGTMLMDPGHDALSFVQRLGRVARGDKAGKVVVRLDPGRLSRQPWLRGMLSALSAAPDLPCLPILRFLDIVLAAARERFRVGGELQSDEPPRTFRSMPHQAVWAACLFWHALERGQRRHASGQRRALRALMPGKAKHIAHLLRVLEGDGPDNSRFARRWAQAFLAQAATLRDFAPTVKVVEPGGTCRGAVPLHFIESRPALAALPLLADDQGSWVLHLDRSLDAALREEAKVAREARRTVLLPDGQSRTVPLKQAVDEALRLMRHKKSSPGLTAREEEEFGAAIELVRLSRLVPGENDLLPAESGGIV